MSLFAHRKELKEGGKVIFSDVELDKEEVNQERCTLGKRKAVRKRKAGDTLCLLKVTLKYKRGKTYSNPQ